jgi:hypothetical protein
MTISIIFLLSTSHLKRQGYEGKWGGRRRKRRGKGKGGEEKEEKG